VKILCDVYRSSRKDFLYLYVTADDGLERVPDELMKQFGEPEKTLSFELTADRTLAREDPVKIMANLQEKGYHLQLPPADGENRE
jgi:uncharacterized protein YcgL (UPF0745 family)